MLIERIKQRGLRRRYGLKASDLCLYGGSFPVDHSMENADAIMSGNMIVDTWIKEEISYKLDTFNWGGVYSSSPTTYQLFLQGLEPVVYLTGAFALSGDPDYYDKAIEIFTSWCNYSGSTMSKSNKYVWDHHASAMRAESILALLLTGVEHRMLNSKKSSIIESELLRHGSFLADDSNYLMGENHGVFQDRALLYLGYALDRDDWCRHAKERVTSQWSLLFDDEMACVENSFTYQRVNKDLFLAIGEVLQAKQDPFGEKMIERIIMAEDFMGYALMPNAYCPPFGDTIKDDYSRCKCLSDESVLAYSSRQGKRGTRPDATSKVYPNTGYYFGREYWECPMADESLEHRTFEDASWAMFRCGYKSITHRQADDNSFMFYTRGCEVFTDAGVYNYMFRNPIRRYVRSANAHNTVVVDEASYDFLRQDNTELTGFCHVDLSHESYDYVVGYNSLYFGVVHFRHFIYFGVGLLIVDELISNSEHAYSQLFHCGTEVTVESSSKESAVIKGSCESGALVMLNQIACPDDSEFMLIKGTDRTLHEEVPYGIIGGKFNEHLYTTVLKYTKHDKKTTFATLVYVKNNSATTTTVGCYDSGERTAEIDINGKRISIPLEPLSPKDYSPCSEYQFDCVGIESDGSRFRFTYMNGLPEGIELAWYVHGNHGKSTLYKSNYSGEKTFTFDFGETQECNCAVRLFIRNSLNKKKGTQIVTKIEKVDGQWVSKYWPDWDPTWKSWFGGTEVPARVEDNAKNSTRSYDGWDKEKQ